MGQTALEKLFAQGESEFKIIGFTCRDEIHQGNDATPNYRTEMKLTVEGSSNTWDRKFPNVSVRVVGPISNHDKTDDGETVLGLVRRVDDILEVAIVAPADFLLRLLVILQSAAGGNVVLAITTKSKIEEWNGEGWIPIVDVVVVARA